MLLSGKRVEEDSYSQGSNIVLLIFLSIFGFVELLCRMKDYILAKYVTVFDS